MSYILMLIKDNMFFYVVLAVLFIINVIILKFKYNEVVKRVLSLLFSSYYNFNVGFFSYVCSLLDIFDKNITMEARIICFVSFICSAIPFNVYMLKKGINNKYVYMILSIIAFAIGYTML